MSRPAGEVEVARVCDRCGRTAAPHDYFCHHCTHRLPDPVRPAGPGPGVPAPNGWGVLLTVVGVVLVVGGLIAAAVVAFVRIDPFAPDPQRPGDVVRSYYEAAQDDDCTRAVGLETVDFGSRSRCERNARMLRGTDASDLEIEDELVLDEQASVRIRITLGDTDHRRCTLGLRLHEVWRIDDSVCEPVR
jgi:hypothetical protein